MNFNEDEIRTKIQKTYEQMMEQMANTPKEEMGKRQPGEKGSYEND